MTTTAFSLRSSLLSLRAVLRLDAVVTAANGAAYLALAGPLGDLFGVPAPFLRSVGAFLMAFAAVVWIVAARASISRPAAAGVAAANAGWVAASVAAVATDLNGPSTAGVAWTLLQAAAVAALALLQAAALRRALL